MITLPARAAELGATVAQTHGYISDILSELADLARGCGDRKLEGAMRLLAVEAATYSDGAEPLSTPRQHPSEQD